jgi:general secretion pathway protein D
MKKKFLHFHIMRGTHRVLRHAQPLAYACAALLGIIFPYTTQANTDPVAIADRELIRRQEALKNADRLVEKARQAVSDKNLREAYSFYLEAVELTPASPAFAKQRAATLSAFSNVAIQYANELISGGEYQNAENVAKTVLAPHINPNYKPAVQLLSKLEQKDFNTTITPKFAASRDEVSTLLNQAEGFYATGRYDLAIKRYEQVLNIDPYNIAARNGMEKVNKQRTNYYDQAYNETRSRMLWLVDRAWERPVRNLKSGRNTDTSQTGASLLSASKDLISRKLNTIVIDKFDLTDVTLREAVDALRRKSIESDRSTEDVSSKGVNIVLRAPPKAAQVTTEETATEEAPVVSEDQKITISLQNMPLIEVVRYLSDLAGMKFKVDPVAVSIVPLTENTEELFTKEYRVAPSFIPTSTASTESSIPSAGRTSQDANSNVRLKGTRDAAAFLKEQGIAFPEGSFARYSPAGSKLTVRNTQGNLDTIDMLVESEMGIAPTQVEIESKFVEITQNNINELGFDWLLGPFSIGGGVYGDGGTRTFNQGLNEEFYNNYPFSNQAGANPMTSGLRSGIGTSVNSAVTASSIDALIAGVPQGTNVASPAVLGLAGIFTNPQFQVVIRALSQQKGVDLMTAPKVTTKSGVGATVAVTREFPYPDSFTEPQVPPPSTSTSSNNAGPTGGIVVTAGAVTPATPSNFATEILGIILEVTPQIGADNYTIDMELKPKVTEFDGFVNYGSPIIGPTNVGVSPQNPSGIGLFTLTENVINQPIFSVRSVDTSVSIWDGQTVALGGLIREDVQKVNDKVPILGDIPLAGRLFRSNVDQKIKKNLIIFVTARLLNAEGRPLIQQDDDEEIVEPLGLPDDLPQPQISTRRFGK